MAALRAAPRRLSVYAAAIRFEHTVFALPFAYMGMLLAAGGWPGWGDFLLITAAMAGARTGAMAANRLIDAEIDARNPRTADRALVTGTMRRWRWELCWLQDSRSWWSARPCSTRWRWR